MLAFLDKIGYPILILFAVLILLAPFRPMPHIVEKLTMLREGTLRRPIDILDLLYHIAPTILLIIKIFRDFGGRG